MATRDGCVVTTDNGLLRVFFHDVEEYHCELDCEWLEDGVWTDMDPPDFVLPNEKHGLVWDDGRPFNAETTADWDDQEVRAAWLEVTPLIWDAYLTLPEWKRTAREHGWTQTEDGDSPAWVHEALRNGFRPSDCINRHEETENEMGDRHGD